MGSCVIFCAGEFSELLAPLAADDRIIAADGGLRHVQALGLAPDVILGDFDSLGYVPESARCFPVEKDDTDSMLAVRLALEEGYKRFVIYGGMDGPRLDHTLANLQTLQFLADHGAKGFLIGNRYVATVIQNGSIGFDKSATGILSVFCLGCDAQGVNITGLQYALENGTLTAGFPLGVSNHFVGEAARISVKQGSLLVLYDRTNGLCK